MRKETNREKAKRRERDNFKSRQQYKRFMENLGDEAFERLKEGIDNCLSGE